MSTINVNYMTRAYNSYAKGQTPKTSGKSMADTITEKISGNGKTGEVAETTKTGAVSTKDMTMDEYKQYIHDKISEIPLSPSRMQDTIAINISEAGFEAMKNDPEYEKWVLDGIRTDFAFNDPWAGHFGGAYAVKNFGATKEEYHGTRWYRGCFGANDEKEYTSRAKNSFWERKVENKQQAQKYQEKKRMQKEEYEKAAKKKQYEHERMLADFQERSMTSKNFVSKNSVSNMVTSQMAVSSYEANFMIADTNM